ncbi:hypothetical protein Syun_018543 [Stephania yunnanensis]|uniref:Uncharacterized protein n=1 Tax=Stephania yunnanensis TaxID=152371 RepID=A0AAP0NYH6_9MAGN
MWLGAMRLFEIDFAEIEEAINFEALNLCPIVRFRGYLKFCVDYFWTSRRVGPQGQCDCRKRARKKKTRGQDENGKKANKEKERKYKNVLVTGHPSRLSKAGNNRSKSRVRLDVFAEKAFSE